MRMSLQYQYMLDTEKERGQMALFKCYDFGGIAQGQSGYCFHPWCPEGRASGRASGRAEGKSLSGLYLRNCKVYCLQVSYCLTDLS